MQISATSLGTTTGLITTGLITTPTTNLPTAFRADVFVFLDDVQFKKNEWQNRNKIRTAQGSQWITVPVLHDFGQTIAEVHLDNKRNWRHDHLRSITLNYSKAPYFSLYKDFITEVYETEWYSLSELNIFIIEKVISLLGIDTKVVRASEYAITQSKTERLIALCQNVSADTYLAGADGPTYMDMDAFAESGITVMTQAYEHPAYPQVFAADIKGNFISHMCILDLLCNCGDESLQIIRGSNNNNITL